MKTSYLFKLCLFLCVTYSCSGQTTYSVIIKNGTIYDGLGGEPYVSDVGIINETIKEIGDLSEAKALKTIDAKGLAVSPGFIDMHSHLSSILRHQDCENFMRQGVTTALGGPDGGGASQFGKRLNTLDKIDIGINVAYLVGHNRIRKNVMQLENRAPTESELEEMKSQVAKAMDEGAFGISTGLKYLPGAFSEIDEVIELSKVAAAHGGIYTSHLREEGLGLIEGVQEAIQISKEADITVVLTHHKVVGKPMWGKSVETLAMVDSARNAGLDVRIDQYPYSASSTSISILLPSWARAGGKNEFKKRLAIPKLRDSIKAQTVFNLKNDRGGNDLSRVQLTRVSWDKSLEGKTLKYWVEQKGLEPTIENGADVVIEAYIKGSVSCVFHAMDEGDVERIMKHPMTMIGSDGGLVTFGSGICHPRSYGTFPRVLGHYVREKKIITLPIAIQKMTHLPAETLGLKDRGSLKQGMLADIVIFNPETVIDKATFENPHQYPEGIDYVLINGRLSIDKGEYKGVRAGKVLRKGNL